MELAGGRGGGEAVRTRDHLANTRTLLSWFRSGLAIVAVGFSITKLRVLEATPASSNPPTHLGTAVAAVGLLVIGASLARFLQQRRNIELADFRPQAAQDALLLAAVAVVGVIILLLASGR
jgi:putative membrane protein